MEPTVSDFNDRRNDMCNKIVMLPAEIGRVRGSRSSIGGSGNGKFSG